MSPALWAWSHFSFALVIAYLLLPLRKQRWNLPFGMICVLILLVIGFWPLHESDFSGFMLAHTGTLSVPIFKLLLLELLVAWGFAQPHCPRHRRNANLFWVVCGALIYPSAMGFTDADTYAIGYLNSMAWCVLGLSGIALICKHKTLAICLAAAVLVHQLRLLESPNLWDYLIDPWLCLAAAFQLVWNAFQKNSENVRESTFLISKDVLMSKLERIAIPLISGIAVIAYAISRAISNEAFTFHWMAREDGFLEWLTVLALFSGAVLCWQRCWSLKKSHPALFLWCTAIYGGVMFFGMGEEISWGQRVLGIETPEFLAEANAQKETNLHNLVIGGTSVNKLIFGKILAAGLACYLTLFPLIFRRSPSISGLLNRLAVPIPRIQHTLAILSIVLLVETSPASKRGEITEFAITSLVLLLLLNPLNVSVFRKIVDAPKPLQSSLRRAA